MRKRFTSLLICLFVLLSCCVTGCSRSFTVYFDANGGEVVEGNQIQVVTSANELVLPVMVRDGYEFVGWDKVIGYIDTDTIVKAQWLKKEYHTVTYSANGGEIVEGKDVQNVSNIKDLAPPVCKKAGYTFLGWDKTIVKLDRDYTLTAVWQANTYTISFVDSDLSSMDELEDVNVSFGDKIGQLRRPNVRLGQKFVGYEIDGTIIGEDTVYSWTEDKVAKVVWRTDTVYSIVCYDVGDLVYPKEYVKNSGTISINRPYKQGYTFTGWTLKGSSTLIKDLVIDTFNVSGDLEYTANYTPNEYTITFDTDGGKLQDGSADFLSVKFGSVIGDMPTAVKEGYKFARWVLNGATVDKNTTYNVLGNSVVKAEYIKIEKNYIFVISLEYEYRDWKTDELLFIIDCEVESGSNKTRYLDYGESIGTLPTVKPKDSRFEFRYRWYYYYYDEEGVRYRKEIKDNIVISEANFPGIADGSNLIEVCPSCGYAWVG